MNRNQHQAARISLLVALAAVFVVWLWTSSYDGPAMSTTTDAASAAARSEGDLSDASGAPSAEALERRDASSASQPREQNGLAVLVVDTAGNPVEGAELAVGRPRGVLTPKQRFFFEQEAWASELTQSDALGEARIMIAQPKSYFMVYARKGEQWGEGFVSDESFRDTLTVTLQTDLTIRARVIDSRGQPVAGIHLDVCDDADVDALRTHARGPITDPNGLATYHHVQRHIRSEWGGSVALVAKVASFKPVWAPVQLDAIPAAPVELRLPAHGTVLVEVVDQNGAAHEDLTESVYATLSIQTETQSKSAGVQLNDNLLELSHVALGLHFRVELSSAELRGATEFAGPTEWGQRVTHKLIATRQPTLSGRLVNEQGEPQAGYWHAVNVQTKPGGYAQYFETSADGFFEVPAPPITDDPDAPRAIRFERTIPRINEQSWLVLNDLDLTPGRNQLGDVVLRAPPLLVSGWIVDELGDPVADARISISYGDPEGISYQLLSFSKHSHTSDAQGAFEVRAHTLVEQLIVSASKGRNRGDRVAVQRNATNVRYVLPRVGAAVMHVTFAGEMTLEQAVFTRTNRSTGAVDGFVERRELKDGNVVWHAIPPGSYDFAIRAIGSNETLALVEGVDIIGDEAVTLPSKEVGADVKAIDVVVIGADGQVVGEAFVVINPSSHGDAGRHALPTKMGRVRLLVPQTPCELLVAAPGHATRFVYGVTGDTRVRLEAGLKVHLHVDIPEGALAASERLYPSISNVNTAPSGAEVEADIFVGARARSYDPGQTAWLWSKVEPLDPNGDVTFFVAEPGNYRIDWEVQGASWRELSDTSHRTFTVKAGEQTSQVSMTLSREDLR